jgi:serine protease Do
MTTRKSSVFYGFLIACTSVVAGMVIASRLDLAPHSTAADLTIPATNSAPLAGPVDATTFRTIAHNAAPSVVSIVTKMTRQDEAGGFWEQFGQVLPQPRGGRPGTPVPAPPVIGAGSGFILDTQGFILTNNHVVENADSIEVFLSTMGDTLEGEGLSAKVIGRDELTDVALLQLVKLPDGGVTPSRFGDSAQMAPGDWVMAIGNPFGLSNTVTVGIVSAVGRQQPVSNGRWEDLIQTDAAINRGNSGGPLLNLRGEVVGINTKIMTNGESAGNVGIGFAVPINTVRDLLPQLRTGKVTRGRLGVYVMRRPMTPEYAKELGLPQPGGAEVQRVTRNSPASRAGIEVGDVIIEFNGKPVRDNSELVSVVSGVRPGTTVPVRLVRDGKAMTLNVTVGELDLSEEQEAVTAEGAPPSAEKPLETDIGMSVQGLSASERRELRLPANRGGALVSTIVPYGPAAQAGIEVGDVILSVMGSPVRNPADLTSALGRLPAGRVARMILWRAADGEGEEVLVQIRKR